MISRMPNIGILKFDHAKERERDKSKCATAKHCCKYHYWWHLFCINFVRYCQKCINGLGKKEEKNFIKSWIIAAIPRATNCQSSRFQLLMSTINKNLSNGNDALVFCVRKCVRFDFRASIFITAAWRFWIHWPSGLLN